MYRIRWSCAWSLLYIAAAADRHMHVLRARHCRLVHSALSQVAQQTHVHMLDLDP